MNSKRCDWPNNNELMIQYHDTEWGVPLHDDNKLFEFLVLDAFQAGLSWAIILKKRENLRNAFDNFEPIKIVQYDDNKIQELLNDTGIIRNKLKINATIANAKAFLEVKKEFGSFDKYIWQFSDNKIIVNSWKTLEELPAKTPLSDTMSKDMQNRGFRFVGSTICYAFMQAIGMVNDHLIRCFRYKELV